jgi:hypothetical protein
VVTFLETDFAGNAVRVGIDPGLAPTIGPLGTVSELPFEQGADVVAELLQDHIDVPFSVTDGRGLTPLDVGTVSRPLHPDTERLLRRLGATSINDGSR